MARPANADARATQDRILAHATQLFGDEGGRVSIRRIAAASGVSLATVHHYFGSKEQLYTECIQAMYQELEGLRADLLPVFGSGVTGADAIVDRTVRASFQFAWSHRGALRLLMRTIIDQGHMDPEHRATKHLPFIDEASRILAQVYDREPEGLRLVVQSIMHLVVRYALTDLDEMTQIAAVRNPKQAVEDHLAETALRLLGNRSPR